MNLHEESILKVLGNANSKTITVFGDYCLDKYLYIDPARYEISVETGLTAYQVDKVKLYPGAGGTVTNNLRSLGVDVRCVGLVGEGGEGYDLLKSLKQIGADTELMVQSETIPTNTYMKPMRKTDGGTYSEMNRFDLRSFQETSKELEDRLIAHLRKALETSHGIVIVEQYLQRNCSAVTDRIREELAVLALRFPDKFFFADSRGFASYYRNVIIKCNQFELSNEKSLPFSGQQTWNYVIDKAKQLLAINGRAVVVTLGEKGSLVFEADTIKHVPAFLVEGSIDIVGAGDAASAGIILGLTLGLTLSEAVLLGNCISSITIQQIGVTGSATIEQVKSRLCFTQ
jgi:rfaE bifunctional protein kinase chain/domain